MLVFKTVVRLSIFLILFSNCSDDDPQPECFQEDKRKIVATITNIKGTIRSDSCPSNYTIEPDEVVDNNPLGLLFSCNLTEEFQVDEAKVVFSGYIYESFDTEDICADYFEITEIQFVTP